MHWLTGGRPLSRVKIGVLFAFCIWKAANSSPAWAEEPNAPAPTTALTITPPKVRTKIDPVYPPDAPPQSGDARVVVELRVIPPGDCLWFAPRLGSEEDGLPAISMRLSIHIPESWGWPRTGRVEGEPSLLETMQRRAAHMWTFQTNGRCE